MENNNTDKEQKLSPLITDKEQPDDGLKIMLKFLAFLNKIY
ncbi:MAG: hypothetical protein ACTSQ6_02130 [Candidatus Heimdallarchaeaceae archaeon]